MIDEDQQSDTTIEQIHKYDSRERVALDLMKFIYEEANDMPDDLSREDLFVLYNQCYNSTLGVDPQDII